MFSLAVVLALAQPPTVPPKESVPKSPAPKSATPIAAPRPTPLPEFDVQFTDGSNIRAVVLEPVATVTTRFGKLDIPFTELRKVDFGFRYPVGVEAKVNEAVAKLGAAAFREREEAEKELLVHKEYALSAVRRATKSSDPEVVRRAEPLLKKLLSLVPGDRQQARDYDVVETHDFTVKGRLELGLIKVKTKQFGEVEVRVPEVRAFRSLTVLADGTSVTLDATAHARQGWPAWLDTGVDVSPDKSVEIVATGTIDQWPQEPGKYLSGPAGTQQVAPGIPQQMIGNPGMGGGVVMRGVVNRQFQSGMIVGKVGPGGLPFPVGADFRQPRAGVSGRLYLIVAPSNWGNDSTGSYKVTIKLGD